MKISYTYSARILMSLTLGHSLLCFQFRGLGAEQTPVNLAEQTRVLGTEDPGLLPVDQARQFSSSIFSEAASAGLTVMSSSSVTSRTNVPFIELRQNLALEATEPQLLAFLENVAASNSALRVQALALRPSPDRSRLVVNMSLRGDYRLPAVGRSEEPAARQLESTVLSQRRQLRQAAFDCFNLTKSTLPAGWSLENLSFQDGKQLSLQGEAPAEQVRLLQDVRARFETARVKGGKELFLPSSGDATMRMNAPGLTNFSWSMHFDLRPVESPNKPLR